MDLQLAAPTGLQGLTTSQQDYGDQQGWDLHSWGPGTWGWLGGLELGLTRDPLYTEQGVGGRR